MAYRSAHHPLVTVRFTLTLPRVGGSEATRITATGENPYVKEPLWRWEESWSWSEQRDGLDPTDTLRWVALIALQDHPTDQETMNRRLALVPDWEQLEAFPDA